MLRVVGDLEADGLLPTVTKIWCGVFKDIDTGCKASFLPHQMEEMCRYLDKVTYLVMHNGIDFDLPLMERILDYTYKGEFFDSFIVSQMTYPDRPGGHGLGPWGERFGVPKPEHEDWSRFSDEMLHRCDVDVEINHLTYKTLIKELNG